MNSVASPGTFDGVLEEETEGVTAFGCSDADADAEVVAFGVAADERLREDDQSGLLACGVGREVGVLLERSLGVEQDRSRLHDGHPDMVCCIVLHGSDS